MMKQLLKRKNNIGFWLGGVHAHMVLDCVIHTLKTTYIGVLKEITQGGVIIEEDGRSKAINLDYIMEVEETPKNKKGKRKNIIT